MQYDVTTPDEYLEVLQKDWRREKILEIRQILLNQTPALTEGIEYKMLSYGLNGINIFHLNAQQNYVSLYVGNIDKVDGAEAMLQPFNRGKGCIRISKSINLAETRIRDFIEAAISHWEKGGNTYC